MNSEWQLPIPLPDANKYSRGKLVVVAGSPRYPGAAVLAARAGQRLGAGYTEVITAKAAADIVRISSPSLVVRTFSDWDPAELSTIRENHPFAVCLGPGFVPDDQKAAELTFQVLKEAACPVLVDGGALSVVASKKGLKCLSKRSKSGRATVLTPHAGEGARLAKACGVESSDPVQLAGELASALQSVVVLKGPDTYISNGVATAPMREGTSALAKAGTGDVLAGVIAALLAQGVDPMQAAFSGATIHARAGILAADVLSDLSVTAEDLIEHIPSVLRILEQ